MAEGRNLDISGVPSKKRKIQGRELQFDDIFEETINTETIEQQEQDNSLAICDRCFITDLTKLIALYMCVVCEKYFCAACFNLHFERNKSHTVIRVKRKSGENDEFDDFVSSMMNESEKNRNESLRKTNVCVSDFVDIKHGLDLNKNHFTYGLTGYANKWWVVCDYFNRCIKVFSLRSDVLQRYIRFGSLPHDVTEIKVKNKTTEQDSASCSETTISETDNKPDRKHLLAVTFPVERHILIIDLGKNPAVIHSKIKTETPCFSIDFYDGNLYTGCEGYPNSLYSVSIMSVEGVALKTFQTDIPSWSWYSYLTVLNGNIYKTDYYNHRVVCYNDEGRVLHEIRIDGSRPGGICVDRDEDKVYVSSLYHNKVYELESDLSRHKLVLDQTTRDIERPQVMCFYSDKLYLGQISGSHVTVVRLL